MTPLGAPVVPEEYASSARSSAPTAGLGLGLTSWLEVSALALIHEAKGVLEDQGLDVDTRHVMLVSDMMTSTGEVQQIASLIEQRLPRGRIQGVDVLVRDEARIPVEWFDGRRLPRWRQCRLADQLLSGHASGFWLLASGFWRHEKALLCFF